MVDPGFECQCVTIDASGKEAWIGDDKGVIHAMSVEGDTLTEIAKLEKHRAAVTCLSVSPDGSMLASADGMKEVVVWDVVSREVRKSRMVFHTARVLDIAWAPDGQHLASASLDTNVIVWPLNSSTRFEGKRAHINGAHAVVWTDENTLASAGADSMIRLWSVP